LEDKRLEEAIPLVIIFIIAAAIFSYTSKNIWFLILAVAGSSIILVIKGLVSREDF
jgi:hypothetical protein